MAQDIKETVYSATVEVKGAFLKALPSSLDLRQRRLLMEKLNEACQKVNDLPEHKFIFNEI